MLDPKIPEAFPWRFGDPENEAWRAHRDRRLAAIDAWWDAFVAKRADFEAYFSQQAHWDLSDWMIAQLERVDPNLMWECGRGTGGGYCLALTPEIARDVRPFVDTLIERAPKLPGWEFVSYRTADPAELLPARIDARGLRLPKNVFVDVSPGEGGVVALTFHARGFWSGSVDPAAALVAAEHLLGERVLDTWIGPVGVGRGRGPRETVPLAELSEAVARAIDSLRSALPREPFAAIDAESAAWTTFEARPEDEGDAPRQQDLLFAMTLHPEMWAAAHAHRPFASERYSRHGETFCYVKVDGGGADPDQRLTQKTALHDAIDRALRGDGLGAAVGSGFGRRYDYVDLAIADLDRGLATVREVLARSELPDRTWILFFDAIYAREWVGVRGETPPPPA
jgi:hypothetical protein